MGCLCVEHRFFNERASKHLDALRTHGVLFEISLIKMTMCIYTFYLHKPVEVVASTTVGELSAWNLHVLSVCLGSLRVLRLSSSV